MKTHYTLFTSKAHDDVRLLYRMNVIEEFIKLWHQGYTLETICSYLHLLEIEYVLIAMDLQYSGKLKERPNGLKGAVKANLGTYTCWKKVRKCYPLFTNESLKEIRMAFTHNTMQQYKHLWNNGFNIEYICKKTRIKEIEYYLIALDLEYAGVLPTRKNGVWGTKEGA